MKVGLFKSWFFENRASLKNKPQLAAASLFVFPKALQRFKAASKNQTHASTLNQALNPALVGAGMEK